MRINAESKISIDEVVEFFKYDHLTGLVFWKKQFSKSGPRLVGRQAGWKEPSGYLRVKFNGQKILIHHIVWVLSNGVYPDGEIDHINGVRSDNRIGNLRIASPRENSSNKKNHREDGHLIGTSYNKTRKKWVAQIQINKKWNFLGRFKTQEEAHKAYSEKLKEVTGC